MDGNTSTKTPARAGKSRILLAVLVRAAASLPPIVRQLLGHLSAGAGRLLVARVMLLLGLVFQVVLLLIAGYLIDLALSLMELWAELARKHLELTL